MKKTAPFGTWNSSIHPEHVAGKTPRMSDTQIHDGRVFWCESRPAEQGRSAIMMHDHGKLQCILPHPLSAKSRVHEYGGAPYTVNGNTVYFVLADDQRIYCAEIGADPFLPRAITPEQSCRYSDIVLDHKHNRLIAVCEDHRDRDREPQNYLVSISLCDKPQVTVIAEGHDFFSNPRISPDGQYLIWLTWDHPNMPWDCTTLSIATLTPAGVANPRPLAQNNDASIFQPTWSPTGDIVFVSDQNNWWNLYRIANTQLDQAQPKAEAIFPSDTEFATPQWVFGMSTFGFIDDHSILATYTHHGRWHLCTLKFATEGSSVAQMTPLNSSCSHIQYLACDKGLGAFIGASTTTGDQVFTVTDGELSNIRPQQDTIDTQEYSQPESITFPTSANQTAHALFYPPHNQNYTSDGEQPPLIVICHGGPTGACDHRLELKIQFWTNRGFAVADVNYRGSTGYGRDYRQKLNNKWGIYDVDDVCAVAQHLAREKRVDSKRCIIKGSSAGGYTVLAALAFRDTFNGGVSLYGIGDLEALAKDTHKFEARYLDKLVGTYPQEQHIYRERSPIHFVDNIQCPVILFQGLKDKVVPPNQAEKMVAAVKAKDIPVAYVTYEDEAHGFRNATTIEHMLDSEWQFYCRLFGLTRDTPISAPLKIENL